MNRYLFDQWRSGAPPFDGYILCHRDFYSHEDLLSAKELRAVLNIAVAGLRETHGDGPLTALDDWHEHDGFVSPGHPASWREIQEALASDAALYDSRNDDDRVHRAFYPPGGQFLLRYDILDRRDTPHRLVLGSFDLAAPRARLEQILADCTDDLRARLRLANAKQYFDGKYAA